MKPVMYMGERISTWPTKVYQLFKDREGETYHYSGIRHVFFGSIYEQLPGQKMSRNPTEVEVDGWEATEAERLEYEASKIAVKQFRLSRRKELAVKKPHPNILKAIELLKPFAWHLDDADRKRLFDWLRNECSKRKGKK